MESTYKHISQLANSQRRLIERLAIDKKYSGAQGKVIHYLFNNEGKPVFQKHIEKVFCLRASTATELLNKMEEMDIIKRVPSKTDARCKEIVLTAKANIYKNDVFFGMDLVQSTLTKGISTEDLKKWLDVTEKMISNLDENGNEK